MQTETSTKIEKKYMDFNRTYNRVQQAADWLIYCILALITKTFSLNFKSVVNLKYR